MSTKIPGDRLLYWLISEFNRRGDYPLRDTVPRYLGVSYPYFRQMRNGPDGKSGRSAANISDEFISNAARYLGVPRISVMIAADKVAPEDFFKPDTLDNELVSSLTFIQNDPDWGPFLSTDIWSANQDLQLLVVLLYERAKDKNLISEEIDIEQLLKEAGYDDDD